MKADEVSAEETGEDLLSPGQVPEYLVRREGDVVEIADLCIGQALPEHLGQEHQVIVVNPDDVAGLDHFHHGVAELLVHPLINVPCLRVVVHEVVEVVEERPEGVVAESVVVVLDVVRREKDRVALLPI